MSVLFMYKRKCFTMMVTTITMMIMMSKQETHRERERLSSCWLVVDDSVWDASNEPRSASNIRCQHCKIFWNSSEVLRHLSRGHASSSLDSCPQNLRVVNVQLQTTAQCNQCTCCQSRSLRWKQTDDLWTALIIRHKRTTSLNSTVAMSSCTHHHNATYHYVLM